MIFIDGVYCQRLYLRFLKKFLFLAAQKKFTENASSLTALSSAVCAAAALTAQESLPTGVGRPRACELALA